MERIYTVEITPFAPGHDAFNRHWVEVGPEELFRETRSARNGWALWIWSAKREVNRLIRKNERALKAKPIEYEVIERD